MCHILKHRGPDATTVVRHGQLYLGLNRLAIVDTESGAQPIITGASMLAFNGEIYNYKRLYEAMMADGHRIKPAFETEAGVIEAVMRRTPRHFHRFLDGYYAIVSICIGSKRVTAARDWLGVIPLYYQTKPFTIASEKKALQRPREVMPGETIVFSQEGKILRRDRFDPVVMHMDQIDYDHLTNLFVSAVHRRTMHSERKVCVALSGGLDSSMVLAVAHKLRPDVEAVTVAMNPWSDEACNARRVCEKFSVRHHIVKLTPEMIEQHRDNILYHLEDWKHNPIKYAAMIRNYFTAMHASGTVILCGEGADEIGCGYPPHILRSGLEREWKSFSTLRSMHAINLDRVNKGGMAFSKEFRTPFLDRALVLYCMMCQKSPGKMFFKKVADSLGVPKEIILKPKYSTEETALWNLVNQWKNAA